MYERPQVNLEVERGSTFTFTRDLPDIARNLFMRVCALKLRNSGNPPLQKPRRNQRSFGPAEAVSSVRAIQYSVAYKPSCEGPRRACSQAKYSQERILF